MKLQHYLSKNHIFSRREADRLISQDFVTVDGVVVNDSLFQIEPDHEVGFSNKIHDYAYSLGVVLVNKPRGVWTNCKQGSGEKEVVDLLPIRFKHYSSVGRLDKDSEGLILFTNDGVFANQFLNSEEVHEREYLVTTKKPLSSKQQTQLENGVFLKDGITKPCRVMELKRGHYRFVLTEGKNRQIRRMVEACNTYVTGLKRVIFGSYRLGAIVPGQYKYQSLRDAFYDRVNQLGLTLPPKV